MRTLRQSPIFLSLLCLLLIAARISGAHWHLCFDRTEPPLMVHVGDIDLHADGKSGDHEDIDLKLVDDGLTKNVSGGLDAPALLTFIVLFLLIPFTRSFLNVSYRTISFPTHFHSLHAPPRAPPR